MRLLGVMSNYRRPEVTGATVFFTLALQTRGSDLLIREISVLRQAFSQTLSERHCKIDALVILPDHLHAVLTFPGGDRDYPTRWRLIKARFSRRFPARPAGHSQRKRHERGIWQRRHWEHHIRNQIDLANHIHYCWYNPVRHGLVRSVADWPHSSFHQAVRTGIAAPDWAGAAHEGDYGEP